MSTNQFEYQASVEETAIPEMFWTIYRHKVPGLIELTHEGIVKRIHVREGTIFHATSSDRSDRLGAHLYRQGKLTRDELSETMRQRSESGKRHGQLLIETGLLSPADLYTAIKRDGGTMNMVDRMQTRAELYATIGYHDYEALDQSIVTTIIPEAIKA